MKELLPLLQRPSRYVGTEWGAVRKDPATVRARLALAFPDLYEVGMSYLGQRILSEAVNALEDLWAERVYAPCEETAALMRERGVRLATLESDTDLADLDAVAFHLTHELCYTNILYMLDLAGLPLRAADRDESHPLIMAGGGACFNAEPMADHFDLMVVGDGEEVLVAIMERIADARDGGVSRAELLRRLSGLPGVYIPSFFADEGPGKPLRPLHDGYTHVEKALIPDLSTAAAPTNQAQSFGSAVHDRLTVEIARGCTRGCRFCQAGMIYRPVRERSPEELQKLIFQGFEDTGFEETSFLSLSTGDYSALDELFTRTFDRCAAEQVSISLPSLRVGSISGPIMERMASIRRTGATIAPEAGSQRLRDAINKGVTEEGLIEHVRKLFENGWQSVKLYFMIGLPTETPDDLDAILDLCLKARDAAGWQVKRLQITAAVSPFVPKAHTPFQWDRQISLAEIRERLGYLRDIFGRHKRVQLKFHQPEMSSLEGVFSRGDRRLGPVLEKAYAKGALFSSWKDHLRLEPYLESLAECGLTAEEYKRERGEDEPLPWDHLHSGVTKRFLLTERRRALEGKITEDCRFESCRRCGVCNMDGCVSDLPRQAEGGDIRPRMIHASRDQSEAAPPPSTDHKKELSHKAAQYRIWYEKIDTAAYLSQLELQSVFERAFRRARLPLSFSEGFHPMPRLSFGHALPVGVESESEWIIVTLREDLPPQELVDRIAGLFPLGINMVRAARLPLQKKHAQPDLETFRLDFTGPDAGGSAGMDERWTQWKAFLKSDAFTVERTGKRGKVQTTDLRPMVRAAARDADGSVIVSFDWTQGYLNPLTIIRAVNPDLGPMDYRLIKLRQEFSGL